MQPKLEQEVDLYNATFRFDAIRVLFTSDSPSLLDFLQVDTAPYLYREQLEGDANRVLC
ncbi:MAG: hypothetical protein NVS2B7_27880 [Herpetosiphon sp.]